MGTLSLTAHGQAPPPPVPPPVGAEDEGDSEAATGDSQSPGGGAAPQAQPGQAPSSSGARPAGTPENNAAPNAGTGNAPNAGSPGGASSAPADPSDPYAADPYQDDPPYVADPYAEERAQEGSAAATPGDAAGGAETTDEEETDYEEWFEGRLLRRHSTLSGSTGLHRVREAGAAQAGMFRFSFLGGFNGMSGFLCTANAPCRDPIDGFVTDPDDSQRTATYLNLSVTPFPFLEGFVSVQHMATSNSNGRPRLLQVLGDWSFGVKGFSPPEPDQLFYYGGEAEMSLMTGTGGVGLEGGATSFALRALGTVDLDNRKSEEDRIPLRFHANLGYFFDNSSAIISELENTPPPDGRGQPIERTERYGLDISRVDSFQIGLGGEYIHEYIRPFLEWTIDVPVNRQGYVCNRQGAESRGDLCLGDAAGFNSSPSRLTLGARGYPWQASGLEIGAGVDIGTGATSVFIEEVTPEAPYTVWLSVGYAVDTNPTPEVVEVPAEQEQPGEAQVRRYVVGRVVDESAGAPIPDAIIRYQDGLRTGLVAQEDGTFKTQDLPPGDYTFQLFAEKYRDAECQVTVPEALPQMQPSAPASPPEGALSQASVDAQAGGQGQAGGQAQENYAPQPAPGVGMGSEGPHLSPEGDILVPVTCTMKELPRVADVVGLLIDADTGGAVPDATVTITDKLERSLSLDADSQGAFMFQNVPFGTARVLASAPGYLNTVMTVDIDSRDRVRSHLVMTRRPDQLDVGVRDDTVRLARPIRFLSESDEITADSMVMVEQLAALLAERDDIQKVEIQGHTDDSGSASYSRQLSQQRADQVKEVLTQLGIDPYRLTAKGYGPDQPLVPNVSEANRKKNNRIEVVILE